MTPEVAPLPRETEDLTLSEDLRLLAKDARALAEAELAFQKTRAAYAGAEVRGIVVLGAIAAALAFFALMAFVVGAVIALGPVLTPWGAMAAVTLALLLAAALLGLTAKAKLGRMMKTVSDQRKI